MMLDAKAKCCDISFSNLSYSVAGSEARTKKKILNNINGQFKAGEMSAIMGPSGAGKSSLMNILTGFDTSGVSGKINFGDKAKSHKVCCYVLQDDNFFPWFTVEEAMLLAAALKISNKALAIDERKALIENILQSLALLNCRNTKCGKLSGGQKKRLSIALELIDNPRVIFLDEPLTGLDSSSSKDIVLLLKNLADQGRTIICTIHQPSAFIYFLFSYIYVLDRGICVYQGSPKNTTKFLEAVGVQCPTYHNPADVLLEVTTGEYGDHTAAMIEAAKDEKWLYWEIDLDSCETKTNDSSQITANEKLQQNEYMYPPSELFKLWVLLGRCHVQFYRDWTASQLKLFLHILCAILTSIMFGDSGSNALKTVANTYLCIITVFYLWYTAAMPAVVKYPLEIATLKKEVFNKWYKTKTYYLATLISSLPIHIIFSLVYATIVYLLTSQPFEIERYGKYILVHIITTITADAYGILIGTLASPVNGTFIGAILNCFFLIFSGVLLFFAHMSVFMNAVSYISPHRYAFESVVLTIFGDNRANLHCPDEEIYCHFKNPKTVLRGLGITEGSYGRNVALLLLQFVIFKTLGYFGLNRALKGMR